VDTGFAGALTLPPEMVMKLDLPFVIRMNANLADDSNVMTSVYKATVMWHGREDAIAVLAMSSTARNGIARRL
jgi:clan AA aspartic protease